jgi:hypothetical protein
MPTLGAPSSIQARTHGSSGRKNRKTSSPSSSRLPGMLVRAMHQAKAVASANASRVRGTAMARLVSRISSVVGSDSTLAQLSRVSVPGWPGAALQNVPNTTIAKG